MRRTNNDVLRLSILAALSLTAAAPGLAQAQTEAEPVPPAAGNGSSPNGPPHVVKNATDISPSSVRRRSGDR